MQQPRPYQPDYANQVGEIIRNENDIRITKGKVVKETNVRSVSTFLWKGTPNIAEA